MTSDPLTDIEEIKQLKARYFRYLDTQQWSDWASVFTEDARLQWGPSQTDAFEGRAAIVQGVSAALEGATTVHHGHMPEIELVDTDRARGTWAMFDWVDHPAYDLRGFGHYHEEYQRHDGRWQIHSTRLTRLREERLPKT